MMRSLWTAASGMTSQQFNVDNISNNLANVNTTGFKKERVEFKSLLYQTMTRASRDAANTTGQPVNLQVGHGVRPVATSRLFEQGNMQSTENTMDFFIQGDGFFQVEMPDGSFAYTRAGEFKLSTDGTTYTIVTSDGYNVMGIDEQPLELPADFQVDSMSVDATGDRKSVV